MDVIVYHSVKGDFLASDPEPVKADFVEAATIRVDCDDVYESLKYAFLLTNSIESPWFENDDPRLASITRSSLRSTSAGDVAVVDGQAYQLMICGHRKVAFPETIVPITQVVHGRYRFTVETTDDFDPDMETNYVLTLVNAASPYCGHRFRLWRNKPKPQMAFLVPENGGPKSFDSLWFRITKAGPVAVR